MLVRHHRLEASLFFMLNTDFLTWPNKNSMSYHVPAMFNGELPLLVQPIPYVLSLMCVPYKDVFYHIMALGGDICVTQTNL